MGDHEQHEKNPGAGHDDLFTDSRPVKVTNHGGQFLF
jgi:hypothetical protein